MRKNKFTQTPGRGPMAKYKEVAKLLGPQANGNDDKIDPTTGLKVQKAKTRTIANLDIDKSQIKEDYEVKGHKEQIKLQKQFGGNVSEYLKVRYPKRKTKLTVYGKEV
jgi:hypothetical protein